MDINKHIYRTLLVCYGFENVKESITSTPTLLVCYIGYKERKHGYKYAYIQNCTMRPLKLFSQNR